MNIKQAGDPEALLCKDIAQQLIEDLPGRNIKVIAIIIQNNCMQSSVYSFFIERIWLVDMSLSYQ